MKYSYDPKQQTPDEMRCWLESCLSQTPTIAPPPKYNNGREQADQFFSFLITLGLSAALFYLMGIAVLDVAKEMLQAAPSQGIEAPFTGQF